MSELYHAHQLPLFSPSKVCSACKKEKPLDCFHKQKRGKYGTESKCKECKSAQDKIRNARNHSTIDQTRLLISCKLCTKCNQEKSVNDFHKSGSHPSGYNSACKECTKKYHLQRPIAHSTALNPGKLCRVCKIEKPFEEFCIKRSQADGRGDLCKECQKTENYIRHNAPEAKARRHAWNISQEGHEYRRARNSIPEIAEKSRIYQAAYHLANREYRLGRERIRNRANPLIAREKRMRREALKKGASIGKIDYKMILERDRHICHICRSIVSPKNVHFDHVIPLSRGGAHSEENIKVSHAICNLRKHNRLMEELSSWHLRGIN